VRHARARCASSSDALAHCRGMASLLRDLDHT
jgi:hypothetical protein